MKKIILLFLLFNISLSLFGECYFPDKITIFPNTSSVSTNSIISLEGWGKMESILDGLGTFYPIYLKCGNFKVELELIENCVSQGGKTKLIFQPTSQLVAGGRHELIVENLKSEDKKYFEREIEPSHTVPIFHWTAIKKMDRTPPQWLKKPKLKDTFWAPYGCGHAAYALFDYAIKDTSQVLIKTEVIDLKTNEPSVYYLGRDKNATQLKVGHEMCSGAFRFKKNRNYKVRFELMDACGNVTGGWTDWVEFESPENKNSWW
ncbi:MAG: hypothetical protein AB8B69_18490 [Chitinophagales bacterium]